MKIKEGFLLKEVAGSYVIVPIGDNLVDFSAMITTNETGAFLWEILKKGADINELVDALMSEYDVDRETAEADVAEYVNILKEKKVFD